MFLSKKEIDFTNLNSVESADMSEVEENLAKGYEALLLEVEKEYEGQTGLWGPITLPNGVRGVYSRIEFEDGTAVSNRWSIIGEGQDPQKVVAAAKELYDLEVSGKWGAFERTRTYYLLRLLISLAKPK